MDINDIIKLFPIFLTPPLVSSSGVSSATDMGKVNLARGFGFRLKPIFTHDSPWPNEILQQHIGYVLQLLNFRKIQK